MPQRDHETRESKAAREAARVARRRAEIEARPSMSPSGPAPGHLRVATWNVNSLRARLTGIERLIERARPDALCLQETKTAHPSDAVLATFDRLGYHLTHIGNGPYNGVAIAALEPPIETRASGQFGNEALDREPRVVSCLVQAPELVRVVSVYAPHGRTVDHWQYEYKLSFFAALTEQVRAWLTDGTPLVVAGDINVAPTDSDVFHPDAFVDSTHVTVPEREAVSRLLAAGLVDVDVARWGARARRFTWWNHGIGYSRNLGMRIDLIASDHALAARLETTWIDHVGRSGERPSDHAALLADFRRNPA